MQKRGTLSSSGGWRKGGGRWREACVMDNYRALLSKNKNRAKGFYQPESRRELHPPRNVNANLVKILVSPPQLSSGGGGGGGGRGAEEEAGA